MHSGYLGRQVKRLQTSPPSSSFPQNWLLSMMSYSTGYPFRQSGSAVLAVSPPNPFPTPSLLVLGPESEKEKALMLCKHCSAIAKTLCFTSTGLVTSLEHSTIQAATEKINSIPAKPSAISISYSVPLTSCSGAPLSDTSGASYPIPTFHPLIYICIYHSLGLWATYKIHL